MIKSISETSVSKITMIFALVFLSGVNQIAMPVWAQSVTSPQLQSLVPDERDLQGFVRIRPVGELADGWAPPVFSSQTHTLEEPISPAAVLNDEIETSSAPPLNLGPREENLTPIGYSQIQRVLYSQDGTYRVQIKLILNAPHSGPVPSLADLPLRQVFPSQAIPKSGTFDSDKMIGQESWVFPRTGSSSAMMFRIGQIMVLVSGDISASSARRHIDAKFPETAVEAVAYQILLRAAQQPELTEVSIQDARLAVNSRTLPKNALRVAGQTYVPVVEFAKAMGLTSHWNTKTGALTLSGAGRKTVALTAGSTATKKGAMAGTALTVPVLKQSGQPVMALADLLTVTGGRITGHSGGVVQIKG